MKIEIIQSGRGSFYKQDRFFFRIAKTSVEGIHDGMRGRISHF
jgi:hypothetical protein